MDWFGQSQVFREEEREKATRRKVKGREGEERGGTGREGRTGCLFCEWFPSVLQKTVDQFVAK